MAKKTAYAIDIAMDLVEFDRGEFQQHEAFVNDPATCMKTALGEIEPDAQTISEYADKLIPLIYGKDRPTFNEALACSRPLPTSGSVHFSPVLNR